MSARFLILSAGMGSGHDAVAAELARGLAAGGHTAVRADVLDLFPAGIGDGLRVFYRTAVGRLPALYATVYAAFFRLGHGPRPGSTPLAVLADERLLDLVERERPDVVVAAFHLGAQITGRLRARGRLRVPSAVVITDFAVHRQWLHPGNDLHLCLTSGIARRVARTVGRPAAVTGPLVGEHFLRRSPSTADWQQRLSGSSGGPVLVSAGAWGIGSRIADTARLVSAAGFLPVVLCGDNTRLRRETSRVPGALAPGWVEDMPGLMGASRVLIDNAAGQTALEALATGVPVVGYRPIPGHGVAGVRAMARLGLSDYADDSWSLIRSLDALGPSGTARRRRIAAGHALFSASAVTRLEELADEAAARRRTSALWPAPGTGRTGRA
jgi:UDP-N-acetylglucosamine:LPS N-acetylglucosamine transferase